MTQEDKKLLLKDLAARLPYGIKVLNTAEDLNEICILDSIMTSRSGKDCFVGLTLPDDSIMTGIEMVKPYLRPMSSMTEEEFDKYEELEWAGDFEKLSLPLLDWLNACHFDYRGLIEKGLALEAPEGMYNI